ncbi:hypothetical protein [Arthrobacter sp. fls2-241-R2A-172]|uniref:hypothetical protein n=1 Tax=Arthrobacter sp. fls2-241-R2A-172 TaxID=3040325 RepID=UPI00254ED7F1|nr:hypothetical protein [Arthrobacter sp. fls2-241-R2A-172]
MEFTGYLPPDEFWALNDRMEQAIRDGAAALSLFRITEWGGAAMLGGWQLDNSEGTVSHGDPSPGCQGQYIEVVTTTHDPYAAVRNRWVVIDAQRNPPEPEAISLTRVADVEPLLQARRAALKALRGED